MRPAHLLHRPGAGAAGRAADPVADAADGSEEVLPAVGRLHLAAHAQRRRSARSSRRTAVRSSARSTSRSITPTTRRPSSRIMSSGAEVVFNTIVPPGLTPFLELLYDVRLHGTRRIARLHVLRRELPEPRAGRARRGPVQLPRLLPGRRATRSARSCSLGTTSCIPGSAQVHRRQRVLGHVPGR